MTDPDVLISNLRVAAGRRTILSIDHLAIAPGEILAVLGPNGAGKTTLLEVCLGLRRPTSGRVVTLGRVLGESSALALTRLRRRIGYIPQQLAAYSYMPLTVREVVVIGRTGLAGLLRPLRRADWHVVDEWIERLGLEALREQSYGDLSGGEQRKTLIARAMVQEPRILVLDEPTAHLDLRWREQIVATLEQLCAQARPTMILVCHELEVLPACCRRLILLQRGRVLAEGLPEEVLTNERVAAMYGPRLRVLHQAGRHAVIPGAEDGR